MLEVDKIGVLQIHDWQKEGRKFARRSMRVFHTQMSEAEQREVATDSEEQPLFIILSPSPVSPASVLAGGAVVMETADGKEEQALMFDEDDFTSHALALISSLIGTL